MNEFLALFRGINVSGQKRMKMADLENMFIRLKFSDVKTYIQSGNVLFKSGINDASAITMMLEKETEKIFGFYTDIFIISKKEMSDIVRANPLLKKSGVDPEMLHLAFLYDHPDNAVLKDLAFNKDDNEEYHISGKYIYLYCPNGYGKTKLNNSTFEKKLKVPATTRNWKTATKLLEMFEN